MDSVPHSSQPDVVTEESVYLSLERIKVAGWEYKTRAYALFGLPDGEAPEGIEDFTVLPGQPDEALVPSGDKEKAQYFTDLFLLPLQDLRLRIAEEYFRHVPQTTTREMHMSWVLEETFVNAAKDGNNFDPLKMVRVRWGIRDREMLVYVGDEGEGFNPNKVEDRTLQNLINDHHGRGLLVVDGLSLQRHILDGEMHYLPIEEGGERCREVVIRLPLDLPPEESDTETVA